ncbi:MAG: hypothetical protein ACYSWU_15770 [Planctomycetota bacterium]
MSPLLIAIAVFVGVVALVSGLAMVMREKPGSKVEERLDVLTGASSPAAANAGLLKESNVLAQPLDKMPGLIELFFERFGNVSMLFEQADTSLTVGKLALFSGIMAIGGAGLGAALGIYPALLPVVALFMGTLPLMWVLFRRKRRLKAFASDSRWSPKKWARPSQRSLAGHSKRQTWESPWKRPSRR